MTMLTAKPPAAPLAVPHSRAMPATSKASNHVEDPVFIICATRVSSEKNQHGADQAGARSHIRAGKNRREPVLGFHSKHAPGKWRRT